MRQATRVLITSFFVNLFLSVSKIIVGYLGTSQSLIADGLHSFSDLSTDVVALFGNRLAARPADKEHPFGHGRVEYITSMFIAIAILSLGFTLIKESIFGTNQMPDVRILGLVVITIIVKFIIAMYLLKSGKKLSNQILTSSGRESFTDVVSSVLVFIVVLISQFQNKYPSLSYVDRFGGVVIGILILVTGVLLLRENISILIGRREFDSEIINDVLEWLDDLELNADVFDVVLIKYGPYYRMTVLLDIMETEPISKFLEDSFVIKESLTNYFSNIKYVDVQLNLE